MTQPEVRRLTEEQVASLYDEYEKRLTAFAAGLLRDWHAAQEAVHSAFEKLLTVGSDVQPEALKSWLFTVVRNEAIQVRRRQGREQRARNNFPFRWIQEVIRPDEQLIRTEQLGRVKQAIDTLPDDQKRVVHMRIHEEQKFADIAEELGLPLGTVLTRMRLALKKLKQCLDQPTTID